jgi:hypothetical protein
MCGEYASMFIVLNLKKTNFSAEFLQNRQPLASLLISLGPRPAIGRRGLSWSYGLKLSGPVYADVFFIESEIRV